MKKTIICIVSILIYSLAASFNVAQAGIASRVKKKKAEKESSIFDLTRLWFPVERG